MKTAYYSYLIIISMALLLACKEDVEVAPATYSELLTGQDNKSWEQVSFTYIFEDEEQGEIDANQIYGIPACEQDNIFKFIREGKQLEIYNGEEKCDPESDDLLFRTGWDIINANASLFIGGGDPYLLAVLTEDSLVYGFRDTLVLPVGDKTFWEFPGVAQWVYKPVN